MSRDGLTIAGRMGPITFVTGVAQRLSGVGVARTAAALAFTTLLSLVPVFTVAFVYVARYPLFQDWVAALERFLLRHLVPGSGHVVRDYILEFAERSAGLQGVSLTFVFVTAIMMVATVEGEINAIWDVREPRSLLRRVATYALGITAGPLLIGAAIWSTTWLLEASLEAVPFAAHAVPLLATPLALALATLAFTLLYWVMPARRVPLRAAAIGGLVAALGFEVAKRGFTLYVTTFATYEIVYGALAALPIFLFWIYLSWVIILVGAAVAATLAEGPPRGRARRRTL
jgi:membrane protein